MLNRLRIRNFKALEDVELRIKPLTILIGPNGSGKSTILQALALIRQIQESYWPEAMNGELISLGSFKDITRNHNVRDSIYFSLDFSRPKGFPVAFQKEVGHDARQILREALLDIPPRFRKIGFEVALIEKEIAFQNITADGRVLIGNTPGREGFSDYISLTGDIGVSRSNSLYEWGFSGPSPIVDALYKLVGWMREILSREVISIYPTRGLRGFTRLQYGTKRSSELLLDEDDYANFLFGTKARSELAGKEGEIERALRRFGIEVRPEYTYESDPLMVEGHDVEQGLWTNIVHQGFGANQMSFVVMQAVSAPRGSTLLVEEPEVHLHPRYQSEIVDTFIELIVNEGKQVICSTHSEHLMLRLLQSIAKKEISTRQVAVYFFQKGPEGVEVTRLKIDKFGSLKGGLPGFFEDDFEKVFEYMMSVAARKREDG